MLLTIAITPALPPSRCARCARSVARRHIAVLGDIMNRGAMEAEGHRQVGGRALKPLMCSSPWANAARLIAEALARAAWPLGHPFGG